jgi:hypothetical protein
MRGISFADDRLPAISGVIDELASIWNDRSIYGMSERNILRQLSWVSAARGNKADKNPRSDRAPSWSWVSTDGMINIRDLVDTDAALIGIDDIPAAPDRRHTENAKLVLMAKVVTLSDLPGEFLPRWQRWISVDDGDRDLLNQDVSFVFLGMTEIASMMSLVCRARGDETFERRGLFEDASGTMMKASDLTSIFKTTSPVRIEIV